jgi:cobyrinic acid a,c-diamide synthase
VEAVLQLARSSEPLPVASYSASLSPSHFPLPTVGVIRDRAFTFYYPENLEALTQVGARLAFIDALNDSALPQLDALYIGGGFPEVFLDELEANRTLRLELREAIEAGLPVYAECGGLMYLSQRIHWGGRCAEMVGALPCEVEVCDQPQGHGYVLAEVAAENPFWGIGTQLRGHEFHHSRLARLNGVPPLAYRLARGAGLGNQQDGLVYRNVLASYTHLHADGSPGWAEGLVGRARQYAQERRGG